MNIGHKGSTHEWSRAERDELLASKKVDRYYPSDLNDLDAYPNLADDPTNIAFRNQATRKRRAKSRRRKEQKDKAEQTGANKEQVGKDGAKTKVNKENVKENKA